MDELVSSMSQSGTPAHSGAASAGTPTASGGATPGGPRLVVRNTFLEVFDDPPLEAEGAQQRRPRAQTDITDAKMPRKVSYPMDGQNEQNYFGGGSPALGYGLPPHLGGIPEEMLRDMMSPGLCPGPGGFPPMAGMPGYGFPPPWGFPGAMGPGGMPPPFPGMPGMPPWGFPPMVPPMGGKGQVSNQGGGRGAGAGRRQADKGGGKQDRGGKGGGKYDQHQDKGGKGAGGGAGRGAGAAPMMAHQQAPRGPRPDMVEAQQSPAQVVQRDQNGSETTVMLRNIPNRYTQGMLLNLLDEHNFKHAYDFVYLPMDFRNGVNLGYAFVNLANNEEALRVMTTFQGFNRWYFDSAKVCEVSWAHPHQGLHDHVERYRNSPVMHPSMPEEYKPMIFSDGERVIFPLPTKAIRAPKLRPVHERNQDGDMGTSL